MGIGSLTDGTLKTLRSVCWVHYPGYSKSLRAIVVVFRQAEKYAKAMVAHEKALEWQELFDIALQQQVPEEDLQATAYRVAGQ